MIKFFSTIPVPYKRAKYYHCIIKVWNLWIKNHTLKTPDICNTLDRSEKSIIAKEWRAGTLDLVIDNDEYWKNTRVPKD